MDITNELDQIKYDPLEEEERLLNAQREEEERNGLAQGLALHRRVSLNGARTAPGDSHVAAMVFKAWSVDRSAPTARVRSGQPNAPAARRLPERRDFRPAASRTSRECRCRSGRARD